MPPATPIINSFASGEVSPLLGGRTDHQKYFSACRRLENFIAKPQGPAVRRSGMRYISGARDNGKKSRLISFDFNSTSSQSYVIEIGDKYLRFYKDGGAIVLTVAAATAWLTSTAYVLSDLRKNGGVVYRCISAHTSGATTEPGVGADWATKWVADDTYEIASPWTEAQIWNVRFVQSFDVVYLVHRNVAPQKLSRTGHAAWTLAAVSFTSAPGTWTGTNWPSVVGLYENRSVWGGAPDKPVDIIFSRTGSFEDLRTNTSGGSTPLDTDAVEVTLAGSRVNPIRWIMDQEELLVGTNGAELKVWAGVDSEPVTPSRIQRKRQSAHGSADMQALLVSTAVLFTDTSRRKVREMTFDFGQYKYNSPDLTVLAEHVTGTGIVDMAYARNPDGVLWCVRDDGVLSACTYLREENVIGWHRHVLGGDGAAESVAVIPGPEGDEVWCVVRRTVGGQTKRFVERLDPTFLADGDTTAERGFFVDCGLGWDGWNSDEAKTMEVSASAGWDLGESGTLTAVGHTPFTDPGSVGVAYRLRSGDDFADVRITAVTSSTVADVEFLDAIPDTIQDIALSDWAELIDTLGLAHLEGESVQVLADGAYKGEKTVSSGSVSLTRPAARVAAGLGYVSILQPMSIEAGSKSGSSQTKKKRIMEVAVRLHETVRGKVCPGDDDAEKYEEILSHTGGTKGRTAPALYSEDKIMPLASGYDRAGLITVRQDEPLPMTVICLVPAVLGSD